MAKYDEEMLLTDIVTLFKNNLATKITSINTEKNDSITLVAPDTSTAYFLDMDDQTALANPFIISAVTDIQSNGIGPTTSRIITINVALFLCDDCIDVNIVKRMLRYGRCMREIVEDNFYKLRATDNLKIESLPVLSFTSQTDSQIYKVVGINIISSIA